MLLVSKTTSYSSYHFSRIFNYIADIPLGEYIRRRKLSLAAIELQSENEKIIEVAFKYGYDSADGFTRAFFRQHGILPKDVRKSSVNIKIYPPLFFQIKITGVTKMNFRIEEKEAFEVFGIERVFPKSEAARVSEFWSECHKNGEYERLLNATKKEKVERGNCTIGAVCGYWKDNESDFPYMICATKDEQSEILDFKVAQIPKATWAIFRSDEIDSIGTEIHNLFQRAYSEWLPSSNYVEANGPDIEIYGIAGNGKYYEEVWIPVVKK